MIPWGIYKFLMGDYKMAILLIAIYAVTQLVRQLLQPKLVADSVGMNPLVTLLLLYIGYRIGSVLGMILAVPVGMVLINMLQDVYKRQRLDRKSIGFNAEIASKHEYDVDVLLHEALPQDLVKLSLIHI